MILDALNAAWSGLLGLLTQFVIPDWGALIGLLPVLLVVGVVGPVLTLLVLVWLVFAGRQPRAGVTLLEGPIRIPAEADGSVAWPVGIPYCTGDRLAFASGANRCTACRRDLVVVCPMCGLGRSAGLTTCANCGLVLKVERRGRVARPAGPPPGGAAIA